MSFTFLQSVWTIVVMVTFLGIVAWAYSSKRKSSFDEAARLPFDDDGPHGKHRPSDPE